MASAWGIDIGKAALKAVKLRRGKEGLEIQAVDHFPYPVEEDEDERQEHIADALRTFLTKHKLGADRVVVAIPGLHAFSRFIKLPPVEKSKVGMMVRMEAQQQIPFPIDDVNWDFVQIDRDYEPGEELEVGIFATRTELIDGFLGLLKESALAPDVVTIAPLAVYNFIHYNSPAQDGASIILDIGAEHTDLVIADRERFWIRNLRIAGNDVTKALAERFKIPFAEAEKLKKSSSKSQQAKKIFSAMEPVLKDLVGEIHRSVGFFKSQADDLEIKRVILTGDGARLRNLPKFLKGQLKYDVQRIQRLEQDKFVIEPDVDLDILKNHLLGFGVAMGLAMQGASQARCEINLAPQQLQISSALRTKLPFAIATAACTWLALGLSYVYWNDAMAKVAQTNTDTKQIQQYGNVQGEAEEAKQGIPELEAQAQKIVVLGRGRTLLLEFLDQVRDVLPQDNPSIPDMTITERSQDVNKQIIDYLERLEKEKQNEKKVWLLEWSVRRRPADDGGGEPYKVTMKVAKAQLPIGKPPEEIREEIKNGFVTPLRNRLLDGPFWVRANETRYGEINVGTPEEIYGLHPTKLQDDGRTSFFCVMVTLTFEIGVPPPKPPEPAPESPEEGE